MSSHSGVRALIMSDLHLEYEAYAADIEKPLAGDSLPPLPHESTFDVIILAGDIGLAGDRDYKTDKPKLMYTRLLKYLAKLNRCNKPILFVIGNHEYYHSSNFENLGEVLSQKLNELGYSNIHLLDRSTFEYRGITFIGATLWTSFNNKSRVEMDKAKANMSDYDVIAFPERKKIEPTDVYAAHKQDRDYIDEQLLSMPEKTCVVITHHSPVEHNDVSVYLPSAYQSDLSEIIIKNYKPLAWVHGHIHQSIDKTVIDTRILCNPRGYIAHKYIDELGKTINKPANLNPNFKSDFIVNFNTQGK